MLRVILAITTCALLSLAFLAACSDPEDERGTNDEESATEQSDDDDDQGAARTDDDEGAQGQSAGEEEGEDGPERVGELTDVILTDYEIDMPDSVEDGIVSFALANEGEHAHGISIEPANGNGDGGETIGSTTVELGETEQLELELEAGEYTVFCPVDDHREEHGMETELTVE